VNFEEVGRAMDAEFTRLKGRFQKDVKPETCQNAAKLLRQAAERLVKLADKVEKSQR
jgi:hypothetical protein